MFSHLQAGQIAGCDVSARMDTGIAIQHGDQKATLAILDSNGRIVAQGDAVALEVFGAVLKAYDDFLLTTGEVRDLRPRGCP